MLGVTSARKLLVGLIFVLAVACGDAGRDAPILDSSSIPANVLIHLVDPLDDPEHYCIDVVGIDNNVAINSPLHAHSCKSVRNLDQLFTVDRPEVGQLYMETYIKCLQPDAAEAGSSLYLRRCSESPLQRFDLLADGSIRPTVDGSESLCVAVAPGERQLLGNQRDLRRDLSIAACDATEPNLMRWSFSVEAPAQGS